MSSLEFVIAVHKVKGDMTDIRPSLSYDLREAVQIWEAAKSKLFGSAILAFLSATFFALFGGMFWK